jgi:hypothetical protein
MSNSGSILVFGNPSDLVAMSTHLLARLRWRTLFLALLVAAIVGGCATRNDQPYRAYSGPERPQKDVAVVKTVLPGVVGIPNQPQPETPLAGYLYMVSVDGTPTKSAPWEPNPPRLDLPPGRHTIGIELMTSTSSDRLFVYGGKGSLTADFEAGVVYVLDVRVNFNEKKAVYYLRAPRDGER